MEDFSGLENGQKFRNDADESKWAKLISAIKENSLRLGSKFPLISDWLMGVSETQFPIGRNSELV